jgi:uncharacterized protein (DUF362 family)
VSALENRVAIAQKNISNYKEKDVRDILYHALGQIDSSSSKNMGRILIKPNLCYYWDYSTGETTDPRLVSSIIDYVREKWSSEAEIKIIESDASAMKTKHVFKMLGYEELAKKKSVELLDLSNDETHEENVFVGKHKFTITLADSILSSDFIINVPKLKVGPYADGQCLQISCALKNMFGCVSKPEKFRLHRHIHEVIVGINKLIKPGLVVVDGIIGLGRFPVKLGLVIAGKDNFAVDYVAAKIMGYDPWRIRYLRLANEENIGSIDDLKVVGEGIEGISKLFPHRSRLGFKITWETQLSLLQLYSKISGDTIPPSIEKI